MLETTLVFFKYIVQTHVSKALIILYVTSKQCGDYNFRVRFGQVESYFRNFNLAALCYHKSSVLD